MNSKESCRPSFVFPIFIVPMDFETRDVTPLPPRALVALQRRKDLGGVDKLTRIGSRGHALLLEFNCNGLRKILPSQSKLVIGGSKHLWSCHVQCKMEEWTNLQSRIQMAGSSSICGVRNAIDIAIFTRWRLLFPLLPRLIQRSWID